ncbi:MAG TPA: CPBP family intramembrane glutamic endopeptidase [Candidatus Angelobacter sp.]|nr:CPBP family intramembrane glutamic endopeptidase [Candidatus Angelobacter sp.]
MSTIKAFVTKHSAPVYFALTFTISWGGLLVVVGPGGFPGTPEQFKALLPVAVVAMITGPSIAGLLLTGFVSGRAGLHEFLSRLLKWRVHARWYAAALLIAPILMMAVLLTLSLFSSSFLPGIFLSDDKAALVLSGMAIALGAGVFEELGWTGFVIPRLRLRYGVLATGLIVGLLWAGWHLLPAFWARGTVSGAFSLTSYLLDPFLLLTAFRVLMVWVYDRTQSLLIGILMHVSLTGSARIIGAPGIAGLPFLTFDLLWFSAVWVVIVIVAVVNRRQLSRPPLRERVG